MPSGQRTLVVIGTRPEAIKLGPLVHALQACHGWEVEVCVTAQHRDLLAPVLEFFRLRPNHDLDLMTAAQSPADVVSRVIQEVGRIVAKGAFDQVIVQGDTSSALGGGLAAFYQKACLVHVEAGLRSGNLALPFPEEAHRRLLDVLADYLFAPTAQARLHLLREGLPSERIYLTGNTGIDALFWACDELKRCPRALPIELAADQPLVLLTTHRRENFGAPLQKTLEAVRELARLRPETRILFPVHPNPRVREAARAVLGERSPIHLTGPLPYPDFVQILLRADLILTDSGGIQEEAATLGKQLLILRDSTERPEGVERGLAELVGTDPELIVARACACLDRRSAPTGPHYLYGDGRSGERIRDVLLEGTVRPRRLTA